MEAPSADFDTICSQFTEQGSSAPVLQEPDDGDTSLIVDIPINDHIARECVSGADCAIDQSVDLCLTSLRDNDVDSFKVPKSQITGVNPSWVTDGKNDIKQTEYWIVQSQNQVTLSKPEIESPMLVVGNGVDNASFEVNVLTRTEKGDVKPGVIKLTQNGHDKNILHINDGNLIVQGNSMPNLAYQHADKARVEEAFARDGEQGESQSILYSCDYEGCGKCFTSQGHLRYHQMMHGGQKNLRCNFPGCDRKFSWPAHLKYHHMTHKGERPFSCVVKGCTKSFYTAQRLEVHLRTHTGERPYRCHQPGCLKSFSTAGNLKNHLRIHTGEKPFCCDFKGCKKSFAEYSSLKKHKIVHSGEKPFTCHICGRSFSQSGSRNVHIKKHHPESNQQLTQAETSVQENFLQVVLSSSDAVHFSDNVVTVATEERTESEQLSNEVRLHQVTATESHSCDGLQAPNLSANVVVLTQPHELVSMNTTYSNETPTSKEIVNDTAMVASHLEKGTPITIMKDS